MLVFWLIALFMSFGLFAPSNLTVVSLFVAAAAVCGAVFLMVEMYYPYGGLIGAIDVAIQSSSSGADTLKQQIGQLSGAVPSPSYGLKLHAPSLQAPNVFCRSS